MSKHFFLWLVPFAVTGFGQTLVDLRNQVKNYDFTGASSTKPFKSGTQLPAVCGVGELFYLVNAAPGTNIYACTTTNLWTLESDAPFSSGGGPPIGACTAGRVYNDTTNGDVYFCTSPSIWKKAFSTTDTGPFSLTGQSGATPSLPAAGNVTLFFDATSKLAQAVDETGALSTMVRATNCAAGSQLVQSIGANGNVTCASASPITYSFPGGSGSNASPNSGVWWQDGTTTTACPTAAPFHCSLQWSDTGLIAVVTQVPHLWTTGTASVTLRYQGSGSGNTVQPAVSSGCAANNTAAISFNAAQGFASQATTGDNYYATTLPSLTMTGCSADNMLVLSFSRLDTAGLLKLAEASITFNIP